MTLKIQKQILDYTETKHLKAEELDPELVKEFSQRYNYGFIKRKIIEHKFSKAVKQSIVKQYEDAIIKRD